MRGPPCKICVHPLAQQINDSLLSGSTLVAVAQKYGVSKSSVGRHRVGCLAPQAAAAARLVQGTSATKEPTIRAKAIAAGAVPTPQEVLSLTNLLQRLVNSLDRLEQSAVAASSDGLHASLAALSGQLHRGIEAAGKLQGLYSDAPQAAAGAKFSVTIQLPSQGDAKPLTIDCTPERDDAVPEPAQQVTVRRGVPYHITAAEDQGQDQE